MSELIITQSIPTLYKLRVGYRPLNSQVQFAYLSKYLKTNDIPYSISGVDTGYYEIELTTLKRGLCSTIVNGPTRSIITSTPPPVVVTTTTTTSTSTTSTSTTSTSTTSTTTTIAPIIVHWDFFSNDPGDPQDTTLTKQVSITHNADYTLDTPLAGQPAWFVIKEPSSEPMKTIWYNTVLNNGTISEDGTQVWLAPTVVGSFRYYKSRGIIGFDNSAQTIFKIS